MITKVKTVKMTQEAARERASRGEMVTPLRPENADMAAVVGDEIRRAMRLDRRLRDLGKPELEFLLSMGLTVRDVSDRVSLLTACAQVACSEAFRRVVRDSARRQRP